MDNSNVGVIIIEGARYALPSIEFLNAIAEVAAKKKRSCHYG